MPRRRRRGAANSVFFERGLHATSICGAVGVAVAKGRFGFLQAFCGDRAHPDAVVRGLGTDWSCRAWFSSRVP
jgi:hypothetical protein